jgi:hypothetical protein
MYLIKIYWDDGQIWVNGPVLRFLEFIPIKKVKLLSPFLPQIYHKLNLLILWSYKDNFVMRY